MEYQFVYLLASRHSVAGKKRVFMRGQKKYPFIREIEGLGWLVSASWQNQITIIRYGDGYFTN